jgi:hypothetical protein
MAVCAPKEFSRLHQRRVIKWRNIINRGGSKLE